MTIPGYQVSPAYSPFSPSRDNGDRAEKKPVCLSDLAEVSPLSLTREYEMCSGVLSFLRSFRFARTRDNGDSRSLSPYSAALSQHHPGVTASTARVMHRHYRGNTGQISRTTMIPMVKAVTTGLEHVFDVRQSRLGSLPRRSASPPPSVAITRPGEQLDYRLCKPVLRLLCSLANQ